MCRRIGQISSSAGSASTQGLFLHSLSGGIMVKKGTAPATINSRTTAYPSLMNFMVGRITASSIAIASLNALLYQYLDGTHRRAAWRWMNDRTNTLRSLLRCIPVAAIATGMLLADFSYEQTSKITGGVVASMMKVAGAFFKKAREANRRPCSG